jgi:hypothetical protein
MQFCIHGLEHILGNYVELAIRTLLIYLKDFRNIIFAISNDQTTKSCLRFLTGLVIALI